MGSGGYELRKWLSSCPELLAGLPGEFHQDPHLLRTGQSKHVGHSASSTGTVHVRLVIQNSEVCTISGPAADMKTFVAELTAKGIFAREVACGNIAYHSRYIQDAGPALLKHLKNIIKKPIKRSKKWISTSWPDEKRDSEMAELCSAEYHTNNLLSPVYFEEAARLIPENAVIVEVAPHGLMQAILKRSHPKCTNIPLTRRDEKNPLQFLFEAFGKLYEMGYNLKVNELYPKIQYPVSTETSPLSHLVEWYHEDDWLLCTSTHTRQENKKIACSRNLAISIEDDEFTFLAGHVREGKNVLPEAAILVYVWETLAMYKEVVYTETSVVFRDVRFHTEVLIGLEGATNLKISINKGNSYFEVTKNDVMVASGYIYTFTRNAYTPAIVNGDIDEEAEHLDLSLEDIYQIFKLKGYSYRDDFQRLCSVSHKLSHTKIKLTNNWVTFLDSLIQFNTLVRDYDGVSVPKIIKSLKIDTTDHFYKMSNKSVKKIMIDAHYNKLTGATTCGGIKLEHIVFNNKPIEEYVPDVLETTRIDLAKNSSKIQEFKLINAKPGDVTGMQWEELSGMNARNSVKVCFAAPSMRDVQNAVGIGNTKRRCGMDFSGIDSNGNRVMGLVAEGALASIVEPDGDLLWPVPTHWTLEEAATVPLPYVHAYYCLVIRGCLRAGQTVFITGGAGALGQAVISICLSLKCTVYTSVRDIHKKMFLMKLFPSLNENCIGLSRDIDFYNRVVCSSGNNRCNFVINCATGFVRELAMKCVAFTGIFLDVTDYDMRHDRDMGMVYLDKDRTYVTVDLSYLFKPDKTKERRLLHTAISEGIANGIVKPLSHVVYPAKDVTKAFRLISHSQHRGRALIKIRDIDASMIQLSVIPRKTWTSKDNILIVCDETVLGIQLANHLVKRGVKNLILHLKSKKVAGFIQMRLAKWNKMGACVRISTGDLEQIKICLEVINSEEMLHAIFIIKPKQSSQIFCTAVANLDIVSKNNHPELEHFVILSRNVEKDSDKDFTADLNNIMNKRVEINLPALLMYAELEDCEVDDQNHSKIQPITVNTAFKVMEACLRQNYNSVFAYNEAIRGNHYFERIAEILGVKSLDAIDHHVCLKNLVYNHVNLEELKFFIMENYNIDCSTEKIGEMTIETLKNMGSAKIKENTKFNAGLAAFYKYINSDLIEATEIFYPILTLSSAAEGERTLHAKATNVMLIPGFEGDHQIFMSMGTRLKIRATALQLCPDIANESIHQIALDLKQRLESRFVLEPKFYLLGYSFGVNVALELAALLEKDGLVGVVYCLDSSPDALRVQLDAYLGKLSEEQLQNAVIKHISHLIMGSRSTILETELENTKDWDEKVKRCVLHLKEHVTMSKDYMRDIINTFYKRICLAKTYKPQLKLKSDIVLLKGISHPNAERLDDDYGLSKYSENPVKVFDINSDVALAPYDSKVANVVNNLLEPALLDEFKAKNLCESYM
ncbi:acyl transferase domain-containing protein [Phthorimaea operculella]|nr:acyl transferase domain-containing protein [Phthorimaea operculella]